MLDNFAGLSALFDKLLLMTIRIRNNSSTFVYLVCQLKFNSNRDGSTAIVFLDCQF